MSKSGFVRSKLPEPWMPASMISAMTTSPLTSSRWVPMSRVTEPEAQVVAASGSVK